MSKADVIKKGCVVQFHYTLKDGLGHELDSSMGEDPLTFLQGFGNIVPGLEAQLEGKGVGDQFLAVVPPAQGYGEKTGPGPQGVPRSAFPEDVNPQVGMMLQAEAPDGQVVPIWITGVTDEEVFVDNNHPLAGVELNFDIEVVSIRAATDAELNDGHVHRAGGPET